MIGQKVETLLDKIVEIIREQSDEEGRTYALTAAEHILALPELKALASTEPTTPE